MQIFSGNLARINAHNKLKSRSNTILKKYPAYVMGPNHLAHLTIEEINDRYLSQFNMSEIKHSSKFLLKKQNITLAKEKEDASGSSSKDDGNNQTRSRRSLPVNSVDWLARGYLSPSTDQGACGSCFAFATVNYFRNYKNVKRLHHYLLI